jgi:hypothetical protein
MLSVLFRSRLYLDPTVAHRALLLLSALIGETERHHGVHRGLLMQQTARCLPAIVAHITQRMTDHSTEEANLESLGWIHQLTSVVRHVFVAILPPPSPASGSGTVESDMPAAPAPGVADKLEPLLSAVLGFLRDSATRVLPARHLASMCLFSALTSFEQLFPFNATQRQELVNSVLQHTFLKPANISGSISFGALAAAFSNAQWAAVRALLPSLLNSLTSDDVTELLMACAESIRKTHCSHVQPVLQVASLMLSVAGQQHAEQVVALIDATWNVLFEGWTEANNRFK